MMLRFNLLAVAVLAVALLSSGCGKEVKTNVEPLPEPQSTATSVEEAPSKEETASGFYIGQIDNNSIEIKLDQKPEETAYKAFAFSEKARTEFENAKLKSNTRVNIRYVERGGRQALLLSIEKQ